MRKLLIAVDGSPHSDHAVKFASAFVKEHGPAELHLANVVPKPIAWQTRGMASEAIHAQLTSLSQQAMTPVEEILKAAGVPCHIHILIGEIAEEVVALADKLDCDTIVIGTRGLGAIPGYALGSVSRKVLQRTHLPVVCVK